MSKKIDTRKRDIRNLVIVVSTTLIIGLVLLCVYFISGTNKVMTYKESSDIDYKVMLKDNEFYEKNYQDKNKGYIASIIDSILITNFNYNVDFSEDVNYDYSYKLVAEIDVKDQKNDNNIYHFSEVLSEKKNSTDLGDIKIDINNLSVNFPKYNNIISKFKNIYELNNITSDLNVNLYVTINNINGREVKKFSDKKVASLIVPLTQNTVSIDTSKNINLDNNVIELESGTYQTWLLGLGLVFILVGIIYTVCLVIYLKKSRTAQMIYDKEIRNIMSNYDGYIQRITDSYDIGTSQVLKIESFNDILEIRDTLKQPILMLENEKKDGTFFIIPATNNLIYTYALRVVDIKAKMDGKEVPTYNITEIIAQDFEKKKKYTDKYIKEQITMTTAMPKVDESNVIQGSKDKENNLYDQLERTSSFDFSSIQKEKKVEKKKKKKKKKAAKTETKKEDK